MSYRSFNLCLFVCAVAPLACAVEATDFPDLDEDAGGSAGMTVGGQNTAGTPPVVPMGGKSPTAGSSAFGGTSSTAGKAGSTSAGGKPSGGSGGMASAGKGGMASAGMSMGGASGGTGSGECSGLRPWVSGMSMQIKQDEVIHWMGKRYKATLAIEWTNAECAPDAPVEWCKTWFTADGSC